MRKVLFLLLFLLVLGAAGTNAQVRIGGDEVPNEAAVLDLNTDDLINNGAKGLALPRVSLIDANTPLSGTPTINGVLVYNTNSSLGTGVYYWNDSIWVSTNSGFGNIESVAVDMSNALPGGQA